MAIYEITKEAILPLKAVTLASQNIRERQDLQRVLRDYIEAVAPDTFVLSEEFGDWEDARRRIDLLCLDKQANLVVIELKRTEDGGHMELQAIRYAAMVSKMTFAEAVEAHIQHLIKVGGDASDAENSILNFLGWDEPREAAFGLDVRIVLVSGNFSDEIMTSVFWLNERDLDIRCVRLRPYEFQGKTLLDIQQAVPLPEAAEYQIKIRKKAAEERKTNEGSDWSRYNLNIGEEMFSNLYKRQLFLLTVRALVAGGASVGDLQKIIPARKFLGIPGRLEGNEFRKVASELKTTTGSPYDFRRFYIDDKDLFFSDNKTWALSNQWSITFLPQLDELLAKYPQARISYSNAAPI